MADKAHRLTDEKLEEMEKRLSAIYSRARKEMQEKSDAYFSRFHKQDEEKRKLVEKGKLTEDEYKRWRKGKIMHSKRFTDLKRQFANEILHVNETAMAYINGELPDVYALNYNAFENQAEEIGGYSFTLVDRDTVRNLALEDGSLLPYKEIDPAKDIPWNMKNINAEVLQGILQGESMGEISKRIGNVQEMNKNAAIRTARTMVTGAENRGRQDSYARAEADGIMLEKEWISTNDGRTRHTHRQKPQGVGGEIVPQDKPFSNGLMYPGDPSGRPDEVYNCRCTMVAVVKGFKKLLTNDDEKDKIKSKWDNGLQPRGQVSEEITEDELYSFVAKELNVTEEEAMQYVDAVMAFTDAGSDIYSEIRRYQRKEALQFMSEQDVKVLSDNIETYIVKAPSWNGGETFRGVSTSDAELATYQVGKELSMGGTSSWSGTRGIAQNFAEINTTVERPNSVIFHSQTQSKGTGIKHISVYEMEDEILCSKESNYRIVKTEMDEDFITHVYLMEVD